MKYSSKPHLLVLLAFSALCVSALLFGQSQHKMNTDATAELKKAEDEMHSLCEMIVKKHAAGHEVNSVFVEKFRKSQRAWLAYRDAHLDAIYPSSSQSDYGTVQPMCVAIIKTELTRYRISQLRQWTDGMEEGDVCQGSRPIKE